MVSIKRGKKITLYLIDGEPSGRMMVELSNWTGKVYRIPRDRIRYSDDREDLQKVGVYILVGKDEEQGMPLVYIGESENVLFRLRQHNDKDFWNEAIIFISKDENMNKAHVRYMESKLYEMATNASRSILKNDNVPQGARISEPDKAEMDEFVDNIVMMTGVLGYNIFIPIETSGKTIFYIKKSNKGINAKGIYEGGSFIVFKNSSIAREEQPSCPKTHIKTRAMLLDNGVVDKITYKFNKDYEFTSPSKAASVVLGRNANGLTEWKPQDGKTLKEYLEA